MFDLREKISRILFVGMLFIIPVLTTCSIFLEWDSTYKILFIIADFLEVLAILMIAGKS